MPPTATQKRSTRTTETRGSAQQSSRNNYGHNATVAVNQYLAEAQSAAPQLIQLFEELGPTEREEKDASGKPITVKELEADAFMAYLGRLDVDFEGCGPFVVHNIVQARDFGKCTQDGFVSGWARVMAESKGRVTADFAGQKLLVRDRTHQALADRNAFKQLYDYVFDLGREADKKALDMGLAVGFWAGLYHPVAHPWRSAHVDWLEAWTEYLLEKFGVETTDADGNVETTYKRTVSKDLWSQTRLFAAKTMEDETLGFWSEDQAWPGLIDEFVVWCREKGIAKEKSGGEKMEMED